MVIFSARARDAVAAAEDRAGPSAPVHPRLRPAAAAKIDRLQARLRAACGEAALRLQAAVARLRAFSAEHESPEATALLGELEQALADIRGLAVSELFDAAGLASLQRRLTLASADLKALRQHRCRKGCCGFGPSSPIGRDDSDQG